MCGHVGGRQHTLVPVCFPHVLSVPFFFASFPEACGRPFPSVLEVEQVLREERDSDRLLSLVVVHMPCTHLVPENSSDDHYAYPLGWGSILPSSFEHIEVLDQQGGLGHRAMSIRVPLPR